MEHPPQHPEDHETPAQPSGTSGNPALAGRHNAQAQFTVKIALIGAGALLLMFISDMLTEEKEEEQIQANTKTYYSDNARTTPPIIYENALAEEPAQEEPEPIIETTPEPTPQTQPAPQDNYNLQLASLQFTEDAVRANEKAEKRFAKRISADPVIFDRPTKAANERVANVLGTATQEIIPTKKAIQMGKLGSRITEGTAIKGTLETAISSALPGRVKAIVSQDTYSFDKSTLLIPEGTQLVGEYGTNVRQGQARVQIIWTRLIRPDGATILLDASGTDAIGRAGMPGDVDTHFAERFGASILLTLIQGGTDAAVAAANNNNANVAVGNAASATNRTSEIALQQSINIPPTITVDQGEEIVVMVHKDLDFSTLPHIGYDG